MAVDAPVILGTFSVVLAISSFFDRLNISTLWFKIIFAVFGLLISAIPLAVKLSVFMREKRSRRKMIMSEILKFLLGDYYGRINFYLWNKGLSVYCNINNEQTEFRSTEFRAIAKEEELMDLMAQDGGTGLGINENKVIVDFGFTVYDCKIDRTSESYKNRIKDHSMERLVFQLAGGGQSPGTLIIRNIEVGEIDSNTIPFRKGQLFTRVNDERLNVSSSYNIGEHRDVYYNFYFTTTSFGKYEILGGFKPWCDVLTLTYLGASFPSQKVLTKKGDVNDYINLLRIIKYTNNEGWISMEKKHRINRRGAYVFHTYRPFQVLDLMRKGYNLYEIQIQTEGCPCFIENNPSRSLFEMKDIMFKAIRLKSELIEREFCGRRQRRDKAKSRSQSGSLESGWRSG